MELQNTQQELNQNWNPVDCLYVQSLLDFPLGH